MNKKLFENLYHYSVLAIVFIFLLSPIVATFIYAIATEWGASLLPNGYTSDMLIKLAHDSRFYAALGRSFLVCFGGLVLAITLIIPVIITINYYFPKWKNLANVVVIIPFAIPPVVSSVGLLEIYSDGPFSLVGTPWILVGCYFVLVLPFIYRAIDNNLQAINLADLIDTAQLLGSSKKQAIFYIILPNLRQGLLISFLLGFSFLIGEFVFANILVGGTYETLQVYLYSLRNLSGHYSSMVVISYFAIILIITLLIIGFKQKEHKK